MEIIPEIAERSSILNYKPDEIEADKLRRVLEAGTKAPSAKNRQPWRFIVVQDESLRKKLEEASFGQEHVGQAPAIIAACTTNIDYTMPNGQLAYPIDLAFAISFMIVQAEAEGLGSCVITTFDERDVKEVLTVPFSMRVVMLLLVGYAAEKPFPTERKDFESVISFNHW
ncbi:MAG TPA: nitroreductase family protein [Spirochaetia bacterium]|nr:nitroreductase family protein [Spirochaetia bacterium]